MQQRQHARVRLRLPVRLRWVAPLGQQSEICETRNVSKGGLLVACKEHHREGFPLWVTFPFDLAAPDTMLSLDLREARRRAERDAIEMALAQAEGNISKAAKLLGVSRPTVYDLVQEHGVAIKVRDLPGEAEEART